MREECLHKIELSVASQQRDLATGTYDVGVELQSKRQKLATKVQALNEYRNDIEREFGRQKREIDDLQEMIAHFRRISIHHQSDDAQKEREAMDHCCNDREIVSDLDSKSSETALNSSLSFFLRSTRS